MRLVGREPGDHQSSDRALPAWGLVVSGRIVSFGDAAIAMRRMASAAIERVMEGTLAAETAPRDKPAIPVVDRRARRLMWGGAPVSLTELEFRVLAHLAEEEGKAMSFSELHERSWAHAAPTSGDSATVRAIVQRVRTKLWSARVPWQIESVRGYGYRLCPLDGGKDRPSASKKAPAP